MEEMVENVMASGAHTVAELYSHYVRWDQRIEAVDAGVTPASGRNYDSVDIPASRTVFLQKCPRPGSNNP